MADEAFGWTDKITIREGIEIEAIANTLGFGLKHAKYDHEGRHFFPTPEGRTATADEKRALFEKLAFAGYRYWESERAALTADGRPG